MLELRDIRKVYGEGDSTVHALGGVSLKFRENEFVSILGASGCGKTTLLNIVGGLDRYTSGDLIINGKSTKDFKDADWDTYRNHSVGFVFQSYNLIPHQTVLSNVELALTLSGVSKAERRARAKEALVKVGLGDQLHKKPNQMSGGQMQRVAIARALVNNPDILLADEPTGALDTTTSVQIMDLLKEVAREKLVIMVTHNPDLASEYSTRIVRLSDGCVIDDTNPFDGEEEKKTALPVKTKKKSMSFPTAVSLSFNNLLTKKARTILTSFAGSIGIIGIALILSLSNGIQAYIDRVQEDTLSTYPLTVQKETQDISALLSTMTEVSESDGEFDENTIYVDDSMDKMMSAMTATVSNDLEAFKKHIDENYSQIEGSLSDIQYTYDFDLQVFNINEHGLTQVNPTKMLEVMGFGDMADMMGSMGGMSIMSQMIGNQELLDSQYELVGENSHWPTNANEVVLVVSKDNKISTMTLYMLGVLDQDKASESMKQLMDSNSEFVPDEYENYTLDDFLGMKFKMLTTQDYYEINTDKTPYNVDGVEYPVWKDLRDPAYGEFDEDDYLKLIDEKGTDLVISGIVRPKAGASATSISGALGYTKALTDKVLEINKNSQIINQQKATPTHNVLTGFEIIDEDEREHYTPQTISELIKKMDASTKTQVYSYMSMQLMNNEDFTKMLVVNNNESFSRMFALLSEETQDLYINTMFEAAKIHSPQGLSALCMRLEAMAGFPVSEAHFIKLLPSLRAAEMTFEVEGQKYTTNALMMALADTPMGAVTMPGLVTLAGEQTMTELYKSMEKDLQSITVTDELFALIVENIKADDPQFISLEKRLYDMVSTEDSYEDILKKLGDAEMAKPASINFYAKDFESKDNIEAFISSYNVGKEEEDQIKYTDLIGALMSSVSLIINVISYVLIAFVSISLVVSSIMIGIITYISVLERTKEIGVLRSIGASKKDISRVFNAETLIVGLTAGLIGILFTVLLCLPINAIIHALSGIDTINAVLPWVGGVALVLISMLLTFIAGLIPSKIAAKKDPVEALRTE